MHECLCKSFAKIVWVVPRQVLQNWGNLQRLIIDEPVRIADLAVIALQMLQPDLQEVGTVAHDLPSSLFLIAAAFACSPAGRS